MTIPSPNRWRKESPVVTELQTGVWYRSPLWDKDHLLGQHKDWYEDGIAWCGRPLSAAMEMGPDSEMGGLYESRRKTGKCSECTQRQKEWDAAQQA